LQKFASSVRKNIWYLNYKNCKQAGRSIDDYANKFKQTGERLMKNR